MEAEKSIRYRVNVSVSTKGVKTWDCTVDGLNEDMTRVLEQSDLLVSELERRYPMEVSNG